MAQRKKPEKPEQYSVLQRKAWHHIQQKLSYNRLSVELCKMATSWAYILVGADGASSTLEFSGRLQYVAALGITEKLVGRRVPVDDSLTGEVFRSGEVRVLDLDSAPKSSRKRAIADEIRSGIIAPVSISNTVVGTLAVAWREPNRANDHAIAVLTDLARFTGSGVTSLTDAVDKELASSSGTTAELAHVIATTMKDPLETLRDAGERLQELSPKGLPEGFAGDLEAIRASTEELEKLLDSVEEVVLESGQYKALD